MLTSSIQICKVITVSRSHKSETRKCFAIFSISSGCASHCEGKAKHGSTYKYMQKIIWCNRSKLKRNSPSWSCSLWKLLDLLDIGVRTSLKNGVFISKPPSYPIPKTNENYKSIRKTTIPPHNPQTHSAEFRTHTPTHTLHPTNPKKWPAHPSSSSSSPSSSPSQQPQQSPPPKTSPNAKSHQPATPERLSSSHYGSWTDSNVTQSVFTRISTMLWGLFEGEYLEEITADCDNSALGEGFLILIWDIIFRKRPYATLWGNLQKRILNNSGSLFMDRGGC